MVAQELYWLQSESYHVSGLHEVLLTRDCGSNMINLKLSYAGGFDINL